MRSTPGGDEYRKHGLLYGHRTPVAEKRLGEQPPQERIAVDTLEERIAAASLVVVGTVSTVSMVAQGAGRPITHHDPIWMKAVIEVEAVEKGTLSATTVEVLFPASTDVRWYVAPKFHEGQQGIWILRRTDVEELRTAAYTALHPQDVHPKDRLALIRAVILAGEGR